MRLELSQALGSQLHSQGRRCAPHSLHVGPSYVCSFLLLQFTLPGAGCQQRKMVVLGSMKQEKEKPTPLQGSLGQKPGLPGGIFWWWGHSGTRTGMSAVVPADGMFGSQLTFMDLGEKIVLL